MIRYLGPWASNRTRPSVLAEVTEANGDGRRATVSSLSSARRLPWLRQIPRRASASAANKRGPGFMGDFQRRSGSTSSHQGETDFPPTSLFTYTTEELAVPISALGHARGGSCVSASVHVGVSQSRDHSVSCRKPAPRRGGRRGRLTPPGPGCVGGGSSSGPGGA